MTRVVSKTSRIKPTDWPLVLQALFAGIVVNFMPVFLPLGIFEGISYLGWGIPLIGAIGTLALQRKSIAFPLALWAPWVLWVLGYLVYATQENAFQRSLMLLTPLAVAVACSKLSLNEEVFAKLGIWLDRFAYVFIFAALSHSGLLFFFPVVFGFASAAGAITAGLLGAWMAVRYIEKRNRVYLLCWLLTACIPILFVTRTGILAVAMTLPLVLSPWPLKKRMFALGALALAGIVVFQMEGVQSKMFFSGQGTLKEAADSAISLVLGKTDLVSSDFRTNARSVMQDRIKVEVEQAYWFGNGSNAVEDITKEFGGLTHPHNDWLRLQHDYGTLGMLLFGVILLAQMLHAWRAGTQLKGEARLLMLAGAGAFGPMALFMLTDNVILYVAWFGNIQFAMLGLGYAALRQQKLDQARLAMASR